MLILCYEISKRKYTHLYSHPWETEGWTESRNTQFKVGVICLNELSITREKINLLKAFILNGLTYKWNIKNKLIQTENRLVVEEKYKKGHSNNYTILSYLENLGRNLKLI